MQCSEGIISLGCFAHSDATIPSGITAAQTGDHTLIYVIGGVRHDQTFSGTVGVELSLPNIFCEVGTAVFNILQPDGSLYETSDVTCFSAEILPKP